MSGTTTDPNDPDLGHGHDETPVPQNKKYLVLSPEEIAKGFVRPVRLTYVHCGLDAKFVGIVLIKTGDKGCGRRTTMSKDIAETYARDPKFYGSTYCVSCGLHRPVDEFVWEGTTEKVGS